MVQLRWRRLIGRRAPAGLAVQTFLSMVVIVGIHETVGKEEENASELRQRLGLLQIAHEVQARRPDHNAAEHVAKRRGRAAQRGEEAADGRGEREHDHVLQEARVQMEHCWIGPGPELGEASGPRVVQFWEERVFVLYQIVFQLRIVVQPQLFRHPPPLRGPEELVHGLDLARLVVDEDLAASKSFGDPRASFGVPRRLQRLL
mmetsp:Transcript_4393/g.13835  ORF Transcript_4393/g.13835 Transcript_4393/m.13835 type:complete len:203 (+) Transcript_4393:1491-2099(+)